MSVRYKALKPTLQYKHVERPKVPRTQTDTTFSVFLFHLSLLLLIVCLHNYHSHLHQHFPFHSLSTIVSFFTLLRQLLSSSSHLLLFHLLGQNSYRSLTDSREIPFWQSRTLMFLLLYNAVDQGREVD